MANVAISNMTTTWNNVSTTFTGIKINVTDTASAAASLLMDLQLGGSSRFNVKKDGVVAINGSGTGFLNTFFVTNVLNGSTTLTFTAGSNTTRFALGTTTNHPLTLFTNNGVDSLRVGTTGSVQLRSTASFGFSSTDDASGTADTLLARDAANALAQRNGVNSQTQRVYGTYTDGSNYRRLTKTMSTGGVAEIKPEGAGTGASGNVLHISGLPTSNPGPGILWNNLGIVNVGT